MTAAAQSAPQEERVRYYVWDLVVRFTHWFVVIPMLGLAATGLYIGSPWGVSSSLPTQGFFTMGWVRLVHFSLAIVFSAAVFARIIWMFTSKNRWAKWDELVPVRRERQVGLVKTLFFYLMIYRKPPDSPGHNPLAGFSYAVVFCMYLLLIGTGLAMWAPTIAHAGSITSWFTWLTPLFGGAQTARWIHHGLMWLLLGFGLHHIHSAILTAITEKNGELDSIFSGNKYLPRHVAEEFPPTRRA